MNFSDLIVDVILNEVKNLSPWFRSLIPQSADDEILRYAQNDKS